MFRVVRAIVITLVLLFSVLAAIPTPGNFTHETLKQPTVRDQVLQWVKLFRALGSSITEEELGDAYVSFAQGLQKVRGALLKPYNAVSRVTGTQQGWALFATPDQRPARLLVRAKFGRRLRLLYRSSDPDHGYAASFLEYRRVRALYNPNRSGPPATYEGFARQLSQRVFEDFPDAREVVVALEFSRTTLPDEPEDPEVAESHRLNFEREAR